MTRRSRFQIGAGRTISLAQFVDLAAEGTTLVLAPAAIDAIARSRRIVDRHAASDSPVYGLNTGLGGNLEHRIPADALSAFQTQIIRGRMIALGDALPQAHCRAALLCRIVELAGGRTGVSQAAIDALIAMFNRGVTPVIPRHGSLGASDIGLVSHLVAPAIGLGEAWVDGQRMSGASALAAAGLAPCSLSPKDGLGLISHGSVTTSSAALVLAAISRHIREQFAVACLAFESYRGNPSIFDARLHAARPAAGQAEAAAHMRHGLAGGPLYKAGGPARIQDALCFREIAPVMGTLLAACNTAIEAAEIELNGTTCSPLVLPDDGEMLSSPNFHPSSLALALDALSIALAHYAWSSALRICKLMTASLSGLPKYLSPVGGGSAGYVSLQKTAGALYAEIRSRTMPSMLDSLPVSDTVEDMAPLAFLAARKIEEQLPALRYLSAIEATVAAQALDLRSAADFAGTAARLVHDAVRARVPRLDTDREPSLDVEQARIALDTAEFDAATRELFDGPFTAPRTPGVAVG